VSCSAVRKKLVCTCHGQLAPKSQVLPTVTTNTGRRPTAAAVSHSVQIRRASLDAGSTAGREQATLLHLNYSETGICVIDVYKLHRVTDRQTDRQANFASVATKTADTRTLRKHYEVEVFKCRL